MQQLAEQRMIAYAETSPQARVRYHTVADGHPDDVALSVLGSLLSGRTGRLYKSLVVQQEVANNSSAGQNGSKYEGYFELRGTAKPGKSPEEVEQALYKEIERIQKEPVPADELQKIKNQSSANQFRGLQSNFGLLVQLLLRDANRGWATINTDPARVQAVTPADIQRVANKYFAPENRTVAIYRTKTAAAAAGAAEDPALAGLSDQEKAQIRQLRAALPQMKAEQVRAVLQQVEQMGASAPADKQKGIQLVKKMLEDRLKQLEGGVK
jgi:predicted Zn-dependent peptidase